jgi:hypothetical protein
MSYYCFIQSLILTWWLILQVKHVSLWFLAVLHGRRGGRVTSFQVYVRADRTKLFGMLSVSNGAWLNFQHMQHESLPSSLSYMNIHCSNMAEFIREKINGNAGLKSSMQVTSSSFSVWRSLLPWQSWLLASLSCRVLLTDVYRPTKSNHQTTQDIFSLMSHNRSVEQRHILWRSTLTFLQIPSLRLPTSKTCIGH